MDSLLDYCAVIYYNVNREFHASVNIILGVCPKAKWKSLESAMGNWVNWGPIWKMSRSYACQLLHQKKL